MLTIDGSEGEGGGQILRTALSLSAITGIPFTLERIRARRRRPGLQRQHLVCVKAAAEIVGAKTEGAALGSSKLVFMPSTVRAGDYTFAIGSAGSTILVFQTVLPILLQADAPSRVVLSGGTHNPMAPTFDYLQRVFLPLLARMGAVVETRFDRAGFYPAGGGAWHVEVRPARALQPLTLMEWGEVRQRRVIADVANIPFEIAEREARKAAAELSWPPETAKPRTITSDGPGNVLTIEIETDAVTEIFTGFGERGVSAEAVVARTVKEVRDYLAGRAPVGPYLADQLLLPLALAGGGSFVTMPPTAHTLTNIAVIEKFLPVEITLDDLANGRWQVTLTR
jgi:RNA 3'-terminal phosphate cyclase (ATP)